MTERSLNRRLLDNLSAGTTDSCTDEGRVPASAFTCPKLFARERNVLFQHTPQPVAFSGEVPDPGSYLALDIIDTPVILTRDEHGILHAFINACAHRGAPVASGRGETRSLVCPFHGWAYHLDGRLRGRPEDSSFSTSHDECALAALPVSETHGVICVSLDNTLTPAQLDEAFSSVGAELGQFGFQHYRPLERRHYTVQANWKLVNDLSLESYHFSTLHRDSVAQVLEANAIVDTFGRHSRWAFPLQSIRDLEGIPEAQWPKAIQGSLTYTLFPGVMFLANSLGAQMIRAEPGRHPGESIVTYAGVRGPDCDGEDARRAFEFGGDVFAQEDLPMAEACQRGIAASARDLLLGRNEPLLQFWHRLWQEAVQ